MFLPKFINNNEIVEIHLNYSIKLPDQKFTGFGIKNKKSINLRYWHISLAPFIKDKWIIRNVDIDDNQFITIIKFYYKMEFILMN